MSFPQHQKGMGFAGWFFVILIFGGVLTMGLRLFPHYMDHTTIMSVLDGLAEIEGLGNQPVATISDQMKRRLRMNNIRDFAIDENIEIQRTGTGTRIVVDYEVRVPLVYNLDLVASFDEQVDLRN